MDKWLEIEWHLLQRTFRHWLAYREHPLCKTHSRRSQLFRTNHFFATFRQGFRWDKATERSKFNLAIKNKEFCSNRLDFKPPFIVKLLFISVLQSRGAWFREQSKIFKSCNLFVIYRDELSIYKWTEPWNIKGRFPVSWSLRASVSSSSLPIPLPFFLLPL